MDWRCRGIAQRRARAAPPTRRRLREAERRSESGSIPTTGTRPDPDSPAGAPRAVLGAPRTRRTAPAGHRGARAIHAPAAGPLGLVRRPQTRAASSTPPLPGRAGSPTPSPQARAGSPTPSPQTRAASPIAPPVRATAPVAPPRPCSGTHGAPAAAVCGPRAVQRLARTDAAPHPARAHRVDRRPRAAPGRSAAHGPDVDHGPRRPPRRSGWTHLLPPRRCSPHPCRSAARGRAGARGARRTGRSSVAPASPPVPPRGSACSAFSPASPSSIPVSQGDRPGLGGVRLRRPRRLHPAQHRHGARRARTWPRCPPTSLVSADGALPARGLASASRNDGPLRSPGLRRLGAPRRPERSAQDLVDLCTLWDNHTQLRATRPVSLAEFNQAFAARFGARPVPQLRLPHARAAAVPSRRRRAASLPPPARATTAGVSPSTCARTRRPARSGRGSTRTVPTYGWDNPDWAQPGGSGPHERWHWEFIKGVKADGEYYDG